MKRKRLKKLMIEGDATGFSAEMRARIETTPEGRLLLRRTLAIRRLMALKQYEHPPAGFEERVRRDILRRLRRLEADPEPAGWWALARGAAAAGSFRYAVAALFVGLLAIQVFTLPDLPALRSAGLPVETLSEARKPAVTPRPLPEPGYLRANVLPLVTASNTGADGVQYGPLPSRLVNYEYDW